IVCFSGIVIENISLFGTVIYFGDWAIPITVLWIVAITNTINLVDGLDGLACGISAISSLALLVVSMLSAGNPTVTIMAAVLAGSCLGFLPYNLNPAKIFMGDVGSMFLGFVLAVISIQGFFKVNALVSFIVPFLVLGLPIFDTVFAILRRLFKGKHPFQPDR
ncbi:MAG: MraY family glycosyltransferase, partial [Christensenellaceae bacterium]